MKKVLIANRGEIAVRVIRTCHEMGLSTVAIYSEADRVAYHVRMADEAYCIGPPPTNQSYLNMERIIDVCHESGADAIHPGYGFLSENAEFARLCQKNGITFIGPDPHSIEKMGHKTAGRQTMIDHGVRVVPGSQQAIETDEEALEIARETGFPLLIKAAGGGGGKGMRLVREEADLLRSVAAARREAKSAFNNPQVYIEKFIENPRHVEIQILADRLGNTIHLGERECSIQRRHQKLIEESPSPIVTPEMREEMGQMAIAAAKAVDYVSAGTVEFIVDADLNFYFLEMNTRLQVEHPVTEMVTGLDLVREQIRVAKGQPLSIKQSDFTQNGHSIECRIVAEDPFNDFLPVTGTIDAILPPGGPGVRVDSGVYNGSEVSIYYDPMIAKLIVWAPTRERAIERMIRALKEYRIWGIKTVIPFSLAVLNDPKFRAGHFDTTYVDHFSFDDHPVPVDLGEAAVLIAALQRHHQTNGKSYADDNRVQRDDQISAWRQAGLLR